LSWGSKGFLAAFLAHVFARAYLSRGAAAPRLPQIYLG
jgi:hypothetical protein